jgi:hypothetical protein
MPSEAGSSEDPGKPSQLEKEADQEAHPNRPSTTSQASEKTLRHSTDAIGLTSPSSTGTTGRASSVLSHSRSPDHKDNNNNKDEQVPEADPAARTPSKADEPLQAWEREEMEKLLNELRGHLGKTRFHLPFLPTVRANHRSLVPQLSIHIDSSKTKMPPITSCSTRIGKSFHSSSFPLFNKPVFIRYLPMNIYN